MHKDYISYSKYLFFCFLKILELSKNAFCLSKISFSNIFKQPGKVNLADLSRSTGMLGGSKTSFSVYRNVFVYTVGCQFNNWCSWLNAAVNNSWLYTGESPKRDRRDIVFLLYVYKLQRHSKYILIYSVILFFLFAAASETAHAHVKWFSEYNTTAKPVTFYNIFSPAFCFFLSSFAIILWSSLAIEVSIVEKNVVKYFNKTITPAGSLLDRLMLSGTGAFFISLWTMGGVYLTPELKTNLNWVAWLQFAIAVSLITRMTLPLSAIGIIILWILACIQYGFFHLMDYPIFLALAIYLAMTSFPRSQLFMYRIDVLRYGSAITLMWASIEKFAYPQWSYFLLEKMPYLRLGLSNSNFMTLAGIAEYTMAFALISTPLVQRMSALVLFLIFVSAILPFGKIDAIGHMIIIVILLTIILNNNKNTLNINLVNILPFKILALLVFTVSYYLLQASVLGWKGVIDTAKSIILLF